MLKCSNDSFIAVQQLTSTASVDCSFTVCCLFISLVVGPRKQILSLGPSRNVNFILAVHAVKMQISKNAMRLEKLY